ncbi:hypothetical protein AB0392_50380, partial [Nonomuraea angiospora]
VVGLRPRRGEPGIRDSHVGGPMLWPVDEPWPHCADADHGSRRSVPMVSVAQLYAADVPQIPFPEDTSLVQIVWCPTTHALPEPQFQGKHCRVFWRRSGDVVHGPGVQPGRRTAPGMACGSCHTARGRADSGSQGTPARFSL